MSLNLSHPLSARKTLFELQDREGKVVPLDPVNFGIRVSGEDLMILPLNLPEQFCKAETKINFSGLAKETEPTELWAAQPVLLTKVEIQKGV